MKKVIIDSNIIFASLRSEDSSTRRKLLSAYNIRFYTPNFLIAEIFKYKENFMKNPKVNEENLYEFLSKILQKVHFFNEELISTESFIEAYYLCKDVDLKDIAFVALSIEMQAEFWTRDKELKDGLISKGFNNFFNEDTIQ